MALMSWDRRFAEPIVLPDGTKLATLREAIAHLVETVPSSERKMPVVLAAAEILTGAAENDSPLEFARIATLRAINRHVTHVKARRREPAGLDFTSNQIGF